MNLAMQLRRALLTLGLTAVAIVCVAAKSATMMDARAQSPILETNPIVAVTIAKEVLDVTHTVPFVRHAMPVRLSKNVRARKPVVVRCETVTHG